jgi:hypothetical protein
MEEQMELGVGLLLQVRGTCTYAVYTYAEVHVLATLFPALQALAACVISPQVPLQELQSS